MEIIIETIIQNLVNQMIFLSPLYFINAFLLIQSRVLLKLIKKDKFSFDFPINKKLFGTQKTILGLIFTILCSVFLYWFFFAVPFEGLVLGTGMFFGILLSSFTKRMLKKKSGEKFIFDTIDFVLGAQIFYFIVFGKIFQELLLIIIITFFLHRLSNIVAFKLKLKEIPW